MQLIIERLLNDFERGTLNRRQLAASLVALATDQHECEQNAYE